MNKYGEASPPAILTLLEEAAAEHCHDIDYCVYSLEKQNIGWVLISGIIDMDRYPKYKEKIFIRTWISNYSLVKGYRENIIYDEYGIEIGKAKGIWVFYDFERKKPVPIFDEIKTRWGLNPEISQEVETEKIKVLEDEEHKLEYNIHKSDVDSYKHVNNIRYFHWLIESLPDELLENYSLKRINGKFFHGAYLGEKIKVYNKDETEVENKIFLHTMRSNINNRLIAAAHSIWKRK
ncbi:MAG: thioesterase [Treponema sp.]|nr:thioesterase [Treponema sp.]